MKIELNKEKIQELLDYYHDFLLPGAVIAVCLLLILFILLPQLLSILTSRNEYNLEKAKLDNINANLAYATGLGTSDLETKLNLASQALPATANFDPIVSAIYSAAASSGTAVGGFQFGLQNTVSQNGLATISTIVKINSGVVEANAFIQQLYESFPISNVNVINIGENGKQITLTFYYKPFLSSLPDYSSLMPKVNSQDEQVLKDLSTWKTPQSASFAVPASSSGNFSSGYPF